MKLFGVYAYLLSHPRFLLFTSLSLLDIVFLSAGVTRTFTISLLWYVLWLNITRQKTRQYQQAAHMHVFIDKTSVSAKKTQKIIRRFRAKKWMFVSS